MYNFYIMHRLIPIVIFFLHFDFVFSLVTKNLIVKRGGAILKCLKMKEDIKFKLNRFASWTHVEENEMSTAVISQSPRRDNVVETMLIFLLSFVLSKLLSVKHTQMLDRKLPLVYFGMSFDDFVSISKALFRSSSTTGEVKDRIINLLRNVIPSFLRQIFRMSYITNPKWICEMSSFCMSIGAFDWLVGPTQRFLVGSDERFGVPKSSASDSKLATCDPLVGDGNLIQTECLHGLSSSTPLVQEPILLDGRNPTGGGDSDDQPWQSGVKIVECRYLAQSGCKALCLHLCKAPTQEFFAKELGMPLYMKPDFTNNSCEMRFGVTPPKEEDDPVFQEGCFSTCLNNFKIRSSKTHKSTSSSE